MLQKVTPIQPPARVSRTKGHLSKRTSFVRDIVREVAGLAPYERRVIELLRNSKDKRARKLAKKRVCFYIFRLTALRMRMIWWAKANEFAKQLGTLTRSKRKVDELQRVIAEARRAGH